MSTGAYIVNIEEFINGLGDKIHVEVNGDLNVDFTPTQTILEQYLPEIKALIEAILRGQVVEGSPKMKGEMLHLDNAGIRDIVLQTEKNIAISGITYWQSRFSSQDKYDLLILTNNGYITLLDGLYAKDFADHKTISPAIPVPAGCPVAVRVHHGGDYEMDVCVDFEYIELEEKK